MRNFEQLRLDSFVQKLAGDRQLEAQARGCQSILDLQRVPVLHADPALLRRAVALHDGRIWAEKSPPGLRVHVELPVR